MSSPKAAYCLLIAGAALFSTGGAAIKATDLSSWQVGSFRSLIAAAALLLMVPGARRRWNRNLVAVGVAQAATLLLFVHANKLTTAANAILLQSSAPIYILLLAPRFLGEKPRRSDLGFMAVLAAGTAAFFIGLDRPFETAPDPASGNLLGAASGLTWALTLMGLRHLQLTEKDPVGASAAAVVCGNLIAFAVALPLALPVAVSSAADWAIVLFLGVFQIGVGYVFLTAALRRVRALEASLFVLLEPVLNVLLVWWIHGERPAPFAVLGGALVLGGTTARSWLESRRGVGGG